MGNRIVAFDVETPNSANDRICSIGLSIIEDGTVIGGKYFLVNPECRFDSFNVGIHGITPKDVADADAFPVIWEQIEPLFKENLIAAHNANFDLSVLKKTLAHYGLSGVQLNYVCTLDISHSLLNLQHYKLGNICGYFGIGINSHHALSDSNACAEILCRYLARGIILDDYMKSYWLDSTYCNIDISERKKRLSDNSQALIKLNGILEGIACDNKLTEEEIFHLQEWLDSHSDLNGHYPYDKINLKLQEVLADGVLEYSELKDMLQLFKNISNPVESFCACGCSEYAGKKICLSGEFDYGSKDAVSEYLISIGSEVVSVVTKKTDVVLVGKKGSAAWVSGNYGTKIKKALELQAAGSSILIIKEDDFFKD